MDMNTHADSSTRWLLPVGSINGETEAATSAARGWLAPEHALSSTSGPPSLHQSNRRQFQGIIQQFQVIWRNYRMTGWERGEIFSMFGVEELPPGSDEADSEEGGIL